MHHRTLALDDDLVHVVDDRSWIANPSETLHAVERARSRQMIITARDVGSRPASLSLLPLIEPDLIFLASESTGRTSDAQTARIAHALAAHTERTGAVIVACGVDSEQHRTTALSLGATFGTGALFPGSESPTPLRDSSARTHISSTWSTPTTLSTSPFQIAASTGAVKTSRKSLLIEMSTHIEWQAGSAGQETMLLGTFQHARHFGGRASERWNSLAERMAYTGVCGTGMPAGVDSLIHSAPLDPEDPLTTEWNVVVLAPHFCCVLSAKDLFRGSAENNREFDYVVSHDRSTVVRCARTILHRFAG
ncbi:DICT sensory domain-containing protein [Rhodococcoides yunnanense]|uniref:DICT sensory domain-containing protein n=1 Tax=Rhodococcoides yunnanense TaxID=278209 RepID=UPI000934CAAE|nr:DICT sensory domain-containing protein [Rhodococcus yunnanensis]